MYTRPLHTTRTKVESSVGCSVAFLVELKSVAAPAQELLEKAGWICKCVAM